MSDQKHSPTPTQADIDLAALQLMGFMDLDYFAEPMNRDFEQKEPDDGTD